MPALPVLAAGGGGRLTAPTPTITYAGGGGRAFTIGNFSSLYVYGSSGSPNSVVVSGGSVAGVGTDTLTLTVAAAGTAATATIGAKYPKGNQSALVNIGADNATYYTSPGNTNSGGYYACGSGGGGQTAAQPCPSGWNPSWAQWPNGGLGGPVCNEPTYTNYCWAPGNTNPTTYPMNPGPANYTLSGTVWYRVW